MVSTLKGVQGVNQQCDWFLLVMWLLLNVGILIKRSCGRDVNLRYNFSMCFDVDCCRSIRFSIEVLLMEKRFTYDSKTVSIFKDGEFWLDGNVDTACNHSEICKELNELHEENQRLQKMLDGITKSLQNELNQYGGFR